jgi:pimeloyl-ACP methyl ester carboxylesterase
MTSAPASPAVPRQQFVQCASPSGLHRVAYTEWGERGNPRVLVCVHGLTRTGRDFDRLAAALSDRYRVVCPDIVGRGLSSWLADPNGYGIAQYVADMVTLIARLDVEHVDWFGTSMGGLIGMTLAGLPGTPVRKLVLNDIGPHVEPAALERIGSYLGNDERFATLQDGIDRAAELARTFGPLSADEWREINTPLLREVDGMWRFHYDPRIAQPFAAVTSEQNAAGEAFLWRMFEAIDSPVLVVRGAQSDLLSRETVMKMVASGRHVSSVEIEDAGHAPAFLDPEQIDIARRFFDGAPGGAS